MLRNLIIGTCVLIAAIILGAVGADGSDGWSNVDENGTEVRDIAYPLADDAGAYGDTWLYPRGSRRHLGTDLMADKLVPIVAVNDSCVTWLSYGGPGGGNMLTLTDDDGWQYRYIHLNNDSPGTDDGANPYEWAFANGLEDGDCVERGTVVSFVGDSGNAEWTLPHLHFEIRRPDGNWINPYFSVQAAREAARNTPAPVDPEPSDGATDPSSGTECQPSARTAPVGEPDAASARGYWLIDDRGVVHGVEAPHLGDLRDIEGAAAPASMTATLSGEGYWIVDTDGRVHSFGDAIDLGDMAGVELNGPVRRIEPAPSGRGYWLVGDDGGVFSFGDARFHGSTGAIRLNEPVISMTATVDGDGYWLVASDGGVFTFGAAAFTGSTGALELDAPVIDMAVAPAGTGYWLYAADGGVFGFGADFHGSAPGLGRCDLSPSVALRVTDTGGGYWIATTNGEVLAFGDALHHGDATADDRTDIIDMAVRHHTGDAAAEVDETEE